MILRLCTSYAASLYMMQSLEHQFFSRHDQRYLPAIRNAVIGIAGAGGLGSNAAVTLARVGIGRLVIADFDTVDATNLNRQQFFVSQIGQPKVHALRDNLQKINPFSQYETHSLRITSENATSVFSECQILIEAFDQAEMKEMLIESWCSAFPQRPVIIGSGLAGIGNTNALHTRRIDNIYICGDEISDIQPHISPMAPRVGIVANMQANIALELVIKGYTCTKSS